MVNIDDYRLIHISCFLDVYTSERALRLYSHVVRVLSFIVITLFRNYCILDKSLVSRISAVGAMRRNSENITSKYFSTQTSHSLHFFYFIALLSSPALF